LEDLLGAAEGRPGVDHPVQSLELAVEPIEHRRLFPRSEQAAKAEFVSAIGAAEQRQKFAPKHLGEDFVR
jgi:hypothetical protein